MTIIIRALSIGAVAACLLTSLVVVVKVGWVGLPLVAMLGAGAAVAIHPGRATPLKVGGDP